ncbi:DUF2744 domain-containing protein [Mycobacteroides chelonae]|uniref:phage gene 29 protein family protein n=1 Tax=Mycobacteroides chelonae TaxID=1774 RepID=UPI0004AB5200|nr:DUF2744 domain-containing protein [Mycobacteroides chelonae]OHT67762.1 hypothetical protein BKG66_24340 [Mycobacteroides chelonae]OHT69405.1 hypothetical protein BKG67_22875 [Mycobacteroides chelonae]
MLPNQQTADMDNPEEHFVWALRALPHPAGSGQITHPGFLRRWSKHLWECAFYHRDWLLKLADENGNIHVSKLPEQAQKYQEAFRGPRSVWNPAGRWVPFNEPDPAPVVIPDAREMTQEENMAMVKQLQANGYIPAPEAKQLVACIEDERDWR